MIKVGHARMTMSMCVKVCKEKEGRESERERERDDRERRTTCDIASDPLRCFITFSESHKEDMTYWGSFFLTPRHERDLKHLK